MREEGRNGKRRYGEAVILGPEMSLIGNNVSISRLRVSPSPLRRIASFISHPWTYRNGPRLCQMLQVRL